jgi:hypothetical protein
MKNIAFVILLLTTLIVSCGSEEETTSKEVLVAKSDYKIEEFQNYYFAIKEQHKYVPFGVALDTVAYFIVSNQEFDNSEYNKTKVYNTKKNKFGIVDFNGNELLPKNYIKIGNIGVIGANVVEIQGENGKYGLCNVQSLKVIQPDYDLIIPIKNNIGEAIILLKKGNSYFSADKDFTITPTNNSEFSKNLALVRQSFNAFENGDIFYLRDYDIEKENFLINKSNEWDYEYLDFYFFTPNFILNFYTDEEVYAGMALNNTIGISSMYGKIERTESSGGIYSFVSSFFYEGTAGRGFENESASLVTVDENNNFLAFQKLYNLEDNFSHFECHFPGTYKFLTPNLVEVLTFETNPNYPVFDKMPIYKYFEIDAKGLIKETSPRGGFPFTSVLKINESYLEVCLGRHINDDELPEGENEEFDYVRYSHFRIEDLEIMKAEILARHSFDFNNDEGLKSYFQKQEWYVGTKSDVNAELSEIELFNITFINDILLKLNGKETDYTKPVYLTYFAAG